MRLYIWMFVTNRSFPVYHPQDSPSTWRWRGRSYPGGSWHRAPAAPARPPAWARTGPWPEPTPASCSPPRRKSFCAGSPWCSAPDVRVRCASPWHPAPASGCWWPAPLLFAAQGPWARGRTQLTTGTSGSVGTRHTVWWSLHQYLHIRLQLPKLRLLSPP